jgi:phosphatase NudJ
MAKERDERLEVEEQIGHEAKYASYYGKECVERIEFPAQAFASGGAMGSSNLIVLVVLVVVPHDGRYLVVEECDGSFYLPAGKVKPGENLMAAAVRETAEEAGMLVGLRGLLGFDHDWCEPQMRMRFAFVGYPALIASPKTRPDRHSRGAAWLTKEQIRGRRLRHPEVLSWIDRLERGATLLPCAAYQPCDASATPTC